MVSPPADGAVHVTSRAGLVGSLNSVRVTDGAAGFGVPTSVTLRMTSIAAA